MLLIDNKVLEKEYVTLFIDMWKLISNTWKIKKQGSYLKYWDVANLHGWLMSQQWPANGFKWVKNASQFNKDFKKSYNEGLRRIFS